MKLMKKSVSVILAMLMLLSCCNAFFVTAADDEYDHLPQVYVTGFGSAPFYYADDPEKKSLLYPIDTERLLLNVADIGNNILASINNGNTDLLYAGLYSFIKDTLGMLALNPDGITSPYNVTTGENALFYAGDGKYTFYYDSRLSPVDVAHQLHDYIGWVKEETGSEKLELVGSSYGSAVVITYMELYKDEMDCFDSVLLCVPSVSGIGFIGELLSGEINVEADALHSFIEGQLNIGVVSEFLGVLNKAGLLKPIIDSLLVPFLREAIFDAVFDICRDVIATIPAIWACVPEEYFEPALINMFGEDYADPDHEYAVLIQKMTYYHENIKLRAKAIINEVKAENEDMHLAMICKYGFPAIPLSKNGNLMEDGLTSVENSSFGATVAFYGEQLGKGYTQALYPDYNFISSDGIIDASTGILPFTTWYIKGLAHASKNEDYWVLIDEIIYNNLDVFTSSDYPQYLEVSPEDSERIVHLLPVEPEKEPSFFEKLIDAIIMIFGIISRTILGEIFNK